MLFFFFNDTATTEIYTLSLHDALPISVGGRSRLRRQDRGHGLRGVPRAGVVRLLLHCHPGPRFHSPHAARGAARSEEHTSELQSQSNLVCRLLLEKKKRNKTEPANRKQ